jgi:hypothetical protein
MSDYFLTLAGEAPHVVRLPGRYPARAKGHRTTDPAFYLDAPKIGLGKAETQDGAQNHTENPTLRPGMTTWAANSRSWRDGEKLGGDDNNHSCEQDREREGEE